MSHVYQGHGVRFEFPDDWILHEQSSAEEISVTIQSPGTTFWSLTVLPHRPDPIHVIDSVLETFRDLYAEVDIYPVPARLGDQLAIGRDMDFFCHELISSAGLRSVATPGFTLLVLFQGADFDVEAASPVLERIGRSLSWDLSIGDFRDSDVLAQLGDEIPPRTRYEAEE